MSDLVETVTFHGFEIPATVYKYRDWANPFHRNLIEKQELFFSSPKWFNDPYDCRIPIAYDLLKDNKKLREEYFNQFVERQFPDWTREEKQREVISLLNEGRFNDLAWIEKMQRDFIEGYHKRYGVISFSKFKDRILMWAHYSNSSKGFCVGFHSATLFDAKDTFGSGGPVDYPNQFPIILPTDDIPDRFFKLFFRKHEMWAYEKEFRLVKGNCSDKTVKIPKEAISEINIGALMPDVDREGLISTIRKELPDAKIFQARTAFKEFKIEFDEV